MHMVFHPADDDGLAVKLIQNATEVPVHFFTEIFVPQEWTAVFRGKNRMHQDFCERLWHQFLIQPFQG